MVLFTLIFMVLSASACYDADKTHVDADEHYPSGDITFAPSNVRKVLDKQQEAAFRFFYDGADPATGMIYEGTERGTCITTGGTGFGVMALCVGVERGWITRDEAADRVLKIIRFLTECERYHGAWSHWYNPDGSYMAFGNQRATGDLVESSFVMQGLLAAMEYFDREDQKERDIRDGIENLYRTLDWSFYTGGPGNSLYWLWYSETDTFELPVAGWNEGLVTYLMALSAPEEHTISVDTYRNGWGMTSYPDRVTNGYKLPLGSQVKGGPLFFTHYSFLGYDPRYMMDGKCWYFMQNQSHTMLNRHYCLYEAPKGHGYGPGLWGLTACYGAGSTPSYSARNPLKDDGVIAPTAAISSMPYTPFYSVQVLMELDKIAEVEGRYGFADSYKPSERVADRRHLAIDQGPIVVMIENYRSSLVWNLLMKNEYARRGLERAGIMKPELENGFAGVVADSVTGYCDLLQHPDRKMYEIPYFISGAGPLQFTVTKEGASKPVKEIPVNPVDGLSVLAFDADKITRGARYVITMSDGSGRIDELYTVLH